jgi:carboxypeptidase Q
MRARLCLSVIGLSSTFVPSPALAQEPVDLAMTARIETEGLERSQALALYRALTDEIGARLTGSPSHAQAAAWARDRFASWGLARAQLAPYEFGRGWSLEKLSIEMIAPHYMPLTGYAEAWTPSVAGVLTGRVVYVGDKTAAEIAAMSAELRGAIVLANEPQTEFLDADRPQPGLGTTVRTGNPPGIPLRSMTPARGMLPLLQRAGAGVVLHPSPYRDGTVGVNGNRATSDDAVPSMILAAEQYNMLARLAAAGEPPELRVELRTRYYQDDTRSYNVIAEIPGIDPALRNEVVLVGGHLDSWHSGIGATDNGDGAVAVMEAMRILAAVDAHPRRTIRAVLWSGEEEGLLGSRAYVADSLASPAGRDKIAVYLNDDPGSGKTLGFYMQGNPAAKAIFDAWLQPLKQLGATNNVIEGIGSTDHVPFDDVGVPAFNVIKDFDAYDQHTRHTNADYPDRMSEDDLKESAIFLAHFAWQAAQRDQKIPRKPAS